MAATPSGFSRSRGPTTRPSYPVVDLQVQALGVCYRAAHSIISTDGWVDHRRPVGIWTWWEVAVQRDADNLLWARCLYTLCVRLDGMVVVQMPIVIYIYGVFYLYYALFICSAMGFPIRFCWCNWSAQLGPGLTLIANLTTCPTLVKLFRFVCQTMLASCYHFACWLLVFPSLPILQSVPLLCSCSDLPSQPPKIFLSHIYIYGVLYLSYLPDNAGQSLPSWFI
jgi:hypothetical protein